MTCVDFTPKIAMTEEDGRFRFTFFCDLCDGGFTTKHISASTVKEAFERAREEARPCFNRCHRCHRWICDSHYNEDVMMCTDCAPRQEVYVAKAQADAMRRNIEEAGANATVWQGNIESKVTVCPSCGKPAGTGKFCSNCGASMEMKECSQCGAQNAPSARFCNNCGTKLG